VKKINSGLKNYTFLKTERYIKELEELFFQVGAFLLKLRAEGPVDGVWQGSQLKTEADIAAERMIINALQKFPGKFPVVSEEDLSTHDYSKLHRYWLVDPIDGTASYSQGYSGFVTQAALIENGYPVIGAVYAPVPDDMYIAERGAGAVLNGRSISVSRKGVEKIILIDNYPEPRGIAEKIFTGLQCIDYVESGSIGLKICRVADGTADLFIKDVLVRDWDIAPGHLILHEAGGRLCDLSGSPIVYEGLSLEKNNGLIAASCDEIIASVMNALD